MTDYKVEFIPISDLKPYPENTKIHTPKQIKQIAESIKQFGFRQNIVVDKNGVIVIGHGRFEAAKSLGLDSVPCVRIEDLTDEQIKALRIIDNKTNESEWDFDNLNLELESLDGLFDFEPFACRLNLTMKRNKTNTPPLLTVVTMMTLLMSAILHANTMYLRIKTACNSRVSAFMAFPKCHPLKQSETKC